MLLLLDGHSSHYTPEAIKIAAENDIALFYLPPNTTHMAQPLDVSFLGSLKKHWSNVCHKYMSENLEKVVTKLKFSSLLHEAWFQSVQPETIRSGFRKVGIYPFDAKAIKPLTSSQVTASEEEHLSSDTATLETGPKLNKSVCTNAGCKKWMLAQCLQLSDGLYICGLCGAQFS